MFVVTREGYKLPVDDSSIPEDASYQFQQSVALYSEDTTLKDIWILQLQKNSNWPPTNSRKVEYEFVQELRFAHEPTKEEILWAMSAYGLTRYDIASVTKVYELDMSYE